MWLILQISFFYALNLIQFLGSILYMELPILVHWMFCSVERNPLFFVVLQLLCDSSFVTQSSMGFFGWCLILCCSFFNMYAIVFFTIVVNFVDSLAFYISLFSFSLPYCFAFPWLTRTLLSPSYTLPISTSNHAISVTCYLYFCRSTKKYWNSTVYWKYFMIFGISSSSLINILILTY